VESKLKYSRVLVSGGAGFIGSHLVDALINDGFEVSVLDSLSSGRIVNIEHHLGSKKLRFVKGDIRDIDAINEVLEDVEVIYHLAAVTSVPYSVENPEVTYDVNVIGTTNLLEMCLRSNSMERFIYVSTCAVYGEPKYLPIDEKHPINPVSPYAATKLAAEHSCREFQEMNGLKIAILRPFNVYGQRQRSDEFGGVIASFIENLRNRKPLVIYGDGSQTRDFIHVEDAVRAFMSVMNRESAIGRAFNIASGVSASINQLVQLLIKIFGAKNVRLQYQHARQGDIKHSYADIKEANVYLEFGPRISLEEGLLNLVKV